MGWCDGNEPKKTPSDFLERLKKCDGMLTDEEARLWLGELLEYDLGFTWELLSKQKLFPFQELIIQGWFRKDYCLTVAGRGIGKSYLIAVFCILYAIFNPNAKIVLVANVFKRVKDIFNQMERFFNHPDALLLRQCFRAETKNKVKISYLPDAIMLHCLNGAYVRGLPMGGENLRGERANVLIIDEGLLISEHIFETILRPFLTAKLNVKEQIEVREAEDELIAAGTIEEGDRTFFPNNKLIITSSASYQFEYLYQGIYKPYVDTILKESAAREKSDPSHFVLRMSYEAVPEGTIMEDSTLKEATAGKENNPVVRREYKAEFVDASDSYFDIRKLHECTVKSGEFPTVRLFGDPNEEYMLAIDPSYGAAKTSDFFGMGVYLLNNAEQKITQVHCYGKAGVDISEHYEYLTYILTHFKIVWLAVDSSGTEFINGYNESVLAKQNGINLKYITADLATFDNMEYPKEVAKAKSEWNITNKIIVYPQPFSSMDNRIMNEYLQGGVSAGKVWFGSGIQHHKDLYEKLVTSFKMPYDFKDEDDQSYNIGDFIEDQEDWVTQTKRQMALIEVKNVSAGSTNLRYDMPSHLKKSTSAKRARRDNYTCLLMAYISSKHYFNILRNEDIPRFAYFAPLAF